MSTTLFKGGRIRTLARPGVDDWMLVRGASVVAAGHRGDEPRAARVVYLKGGTVVPAFCDAHVHLLATGLFAGGMDFRGEHSSRAILEAFAKRSDRGFEVLFGGNFEEPLDAPLTRTDLDAVVGRRPAMLVRADMHSCVVSTALLNELDANTSPGVEFDSDGEPTGFLRERAAALAWMWFQANLPEDWALDAARSAVALAYSRGIGTVHEMYVVEWQGWNALDTLWQAVGDVALSVVPYVATDEVWRIKSMGLSRIGGDYFLDGSFGSHTAWLSEPYDSTPPAGSPECGVTYRDDEDLFEFFYEAQNNGLQTGVHAIGDAAIEQAVSTWEKVAGKVGIEQVRALRHRIEHFECASDGHIARAARLGLGISVQPLFDRYWGGPGGMYEKRIGTERARTMNRFGSMHRAGTLLGAGSDSTVTPMNPFLQMAALRTHHAFAERIPGSDALYMHTIGGHVLAGEEGLKGSLGPGKRADFIVLDRDPVAVSPDELQGTEVIETWLGGRLAWPPSEAEVA